MKKYMIEIAPNECFHIEKFETTSEQLPVELQAKDNPATCTLDYPFEKSKTIKFTFSSVDDIVNAVRDGFKEMYAASKRLPQCPFLINQEFDGEYGYALHALGDLFIEAMEYNKKTNELRVFIGS